MATAQIIPWFETKQITLRGVTRAAIQDFVDEKSTNGRKDGKGGLAPKTVRHYRNIISQALDAAIRADLIAVNPCGGVMLPTQIKPEFAFYNAEQLSKLCEVVRDDVLSPLIRLAVVYGLRRSDAYVKHELKIFSNS